MAADLMKKIVIISSVALVLLATATWAEVLSDPTRPPPGIGDPALAGSLSAYPQEKGLQSVIMSADHCAAIIDGKTIALGEKYGAEILQEINERGVILQGENGRRLLTLFPAVGMKINANTSAPQPIKCIAGHNKKQKNPAQQRGQKERK